MLVCRKPDANWGSSADAQTFVTAMQKTQELTNNPEHIKNYRPKVLMLLFISSLILFTHTSYSPPRRCWC